MYWQVAALLAVAVGFCFRGIWFFYRSRRHLASASGSLLARERHDNPDTILKIVVEHVHDGLLVQDIFGRIEWSNPAYSRITGFSAEEIVGRRPQEFILADENQLTPAEIEDFRYDLSVVKTGFVEKILNRRKSGELFWNELTFAILDGSSPEDTKIILISRDVTQQVAHLDELEEVRKRLKYRAEHDDLTDVANRAKVNAYLEENLRRLEEQDGRIGVLHLDLDLFKDINDAYGHRAGDAVLVQVARTMTQIVGDRGMVARVGGDEFVVVIPDPANDGVLPELAENILEGISRPFEWEGVTLQIAGSVGMILSIGGQESPSDLINCADIALYEAKTRGRGQIAWYTPELGEAHRAKRHRAIGQVPVGSKGESVSG